MFTIYGDRQSFYQWDSNQKLIVNSVPCSEIHFSNILSNEALVCMTYELDGLTVVDVPNILLTEALEIKAYIVVEDEGGCRTCNTGTFEVIKRDKPADYVYTETEVKRYEDYEERISSLEDKVKDVDFNNATFGNSLSMGRVGEVGKNTVALGDELNVFATQSAAFGAGNSVGLKGYYIMAIDYNEKAMWLNANESGVYFVMDRKTIIPVEAKYNDDSSWIYLGNGEWYSDEYYVTIPPHSKDNARVNLNKPSFVSGYEVGDEFNIIVPNNHYALCGKITAIDGNKISYEIIPNHYANEDFEEKKHVFLTETELKARWASLGLTWTTLRDAIGADDYTFSVPRKSTVGSVVVTRAGFASGVENNAAGGFSEVSGADNLVAGNFGHAEGQDNTVGYSAHAEGVGNKAIGKQAHAEGSQTEAIANSSHTEGVQTIAIGDAAHAEGYKANAIGAYSHAEGFVTYARGAHAHAEGNSCEAIGTDAHAEGSNSFAHERASHAEGGDNNAYGEYSHAEGRGSTTGGKDSGGKGYAAHAEGRSTTAYGDYSHSEGKSTQANGNSAHAEGLETVADGQASHAGGWKTVAKGRCQYAIGKHNITDDNIDSYGYGKYILVAGNGVENKKSNAYTLDWDGNGWYKGNIAAAAILLTAPNGITFKVTVDNSGNLITEKV